LEDFFSMSMKTIVTKYEPLDADTYIGNLGEAWVDNESAALHIGDGTEGGQVVRGTGNLLINNDTVATMNNGEIFLQSGSTSDKFFWAEYGELKFNFDDTWGDAVAKDSEGSTYVVGGTYGADAPQPSAIIVKYSATGELLWNYVLVDDSDGYPNTYGAGVWVDKNDTVWVGIGLADQGEPYHYISALDKYGTILFSEVSSIDQSSPGNIFFPGMMQGDNLGNLYVIAQHQYDTGFGTNNCYAIMKTPAGPDSSQISKLFDNFGNGISVFGLDVKPNSIVVSGTIHDGIDRIYLAKFDSDLNLLWHVKTGNPGIDSYAPSVTQDAQGNIYLIGYDNGGTAPVMKFDSNGTLVWQRGLYMSSPVFGLCIVADTDGSVYVGGYAYTSPSKLFVAKIDTDDGMTRWANYWESYLPASTYQLYVNAYNTLVLQDDVLTLTGYTYAGADPSVAYYNSNLITVALPKDGTVVDNRFVNFAYVTSDINNDPLDYPVTPLTLDALIEVDYIWSPYFFTTVYGWDEGPDGEGVFQSTTYALGSMYEFGTDNKLIIPAGGDIVDSNGVSITGKQYNWTNNGGNIWQTVTVSGGIEFYYGSTNSNVIWWDPSNVYNDYPQFRGAQIQYHAYTQEGTTIGEIMWSRNSDGDVTTTETHAGGSGNETFTNSQYSGTNWCLAYNNNSNTGTVMIQWVAKVYYGSEWGC
jgi:hypothetical protein